MKLYFAAYRNGIKLENGPGDNLYPLDGVNDIPVSSLKKFLQTCCCNKKKDCLYCSKGYDLWKNLPRGFKFVKGNNNKWCYMKGGRGDREHASVYVNGGEKENKQEADDKFDLKEGSVLYLWPSIEHRFGDDFKYMFNMEFRVVAVADADAENVAVRDVVAVSSASKTIAAIRSEFPVVTDEVVAPVPAPTAATSDPTTAPALTAVPTAATSDPTAAAATITAIRSDLLLSSPSASFCSLDIKTPTTTKAEAKSATSASSVYSCSPDGGGVLNEAVAVLVDGPVIDNPYEGVTATAEQINQAFGICLTEEEEKAEFEEQVRKGKAALRESIAGTGFSPVVLKRKRDDDGDGDDGDLMSF